MKDKASFDGAYRVGVVRGPLSLFRLCGRNAAGEANNKYGRCWLNERFFWDAIDVVSNSTSNPAQFNHYLRLILREYTAVCHDWNSFAAIYQLRIPAGKNVEVAVGRIAAQPFYSADDPGRRSSLPHQLLVGGEFQYIVDINSEEMKRWVSGPLPMHFAVGRA
jgi:hypothetical protein